jgi:hypothetical protein
MALDPEMKKQLFGASIVPEASKSQEVQHTGDIFFKEDEDKKVKISLYVKPSLDKRLKQLSKRYNRSLNSFLELLIDQASKDLE